MKIIDKRKKQIYFSDIKIGDTFIADEILCVKLKPFTDDKYNQYNAFDLINNDLIYFCDGDIIVKVESTLTIL